MRTKGQEDKKTGGRRTGRQEAEGQEDRTTEDRKTVGGGAERESFSELPL